MLKKTVKAAMDRYDELQDKLPSSYKDFIESNSAWEGYLGDDFGYAVIWCRTSIQERWNEYEMAQYLSEHWFPFGSNGGGEMLCFDLLSMSDCVFQMPYIGMSDDEALPYWQSFAEVIAIIYKING